MILLMRITVIFTVLVLFANHQTHADDCVNRPCLNGGECISTPDGNSCNCTVYYTGKKCQIRTSYCDPTHCLNGGTCYHARLIELNEPSCYCKCMNFNFKLQFSIFFLYLSIVLF